MHELGDQVRLLEQACVLDGDRGLRSQHGKHRFITFCKFPLLFVQGFQHSHHFILGDQRDSDQRLGRAAGDQVYIAEEARVSLCVRDAHRFAVDDDPTRQASFQRHHQSARGRFIQIGGNLEIQLPR